MRTFGQVRRAVAALLLGLWLAGCYRWETAPTSPYDPGASVQHVDKVRIRTRAGSRFELRSPTARGDTLIGSRGDSLVVIAFADVTRVERRVEAPERSLALVALGAFLVVGAAVTGSGGWCFGQPSC